MTENISPNIMQSKNSNMSSSSHSHGHSTSTAFSHSPKPAKANKSVEETYIKLSHLDQILTRPDTYIGSIEAETEGTWIWDMSDNDCGECSSSDSDVEMIDDDDNYSDAASNGNTKKKKSVKKSKSSSSSDDVLKGRMVKKDCVIVPGLFKIFDEILVNAADHRQRDKTMKTLKVEINVEKNFISVYNDGTGKHS
jgi:DNA topoisomerase II